MKFSSILVCLTLTAASTQAFWFGSSGPVTTQPPAKNVCVDSSVLCGAWTQAQCQANTLKCCKTCSKYGTAAVVVETNTNERGTNTGGNTNEGSDMTNSLIHDVAQAMGIAESAVSPSALRAFCAQNGYTKWIGSGPEPALPSGLVGNAWSAWGKVTGVGWGLITPSSGMSGKCAGAGWGAPDTVTETHNNVNNNGGNTNVGNINGNGEGTISGGNTNEGTDMTNSLIHDVAKIMGVAESAVSPSALRAFCAQNGYTKWIGSGPEPEAPSGLVSSAWAAWGKATGVGWGLITPASGMSGKCAGAGWGAPDTVTETHNNVNNNGGYTNVGNTNYGNDQGTVSGGDTNEGTDMTNSLIHDVAKIMGVAESAVSPSALRAFCAQNGYTKWIGSGPEPEAPSGLVSSAWAAWGKATGVGWGLITPASGMSGKCAGAGWGAPDTVTETHEGGGETVENRGNINGGELIEGTVNGGNNNGGVITITEGTVNGGNNNGGVIKEGTVGIGGNNNDGSFTWTNNNGGGSDSTHVGSNNNGESTDLTNELIHDVARNMGIVESAVSPTALRAFCAQNGYTKWIGSGPEPAAPAGLVGNAWNAWGKLTGMGWGAITPVSGMSGKCAGAGWGSPDTVVETPATQTTGGKKNGGGWFGWNNAGTTEASKTVVGNTNGGGSFTWTNSEPTPNPVVRCTATAATNAPVNNNGGSEVNVDNGEGKGEDAADQLIHGVALGMGKVENFVSPSAMRGFCAANGYTKWIGEGPEPAAPSGLVGNAWSSWGTLTGIGWGAITPDSGIKGKCDASGWGKP